MWFEIFQFELRYRMKRPETYVFFGFLLLFSIVGVDFIFQGVELGLLKKNAPLVIAKTMAAITGIFMIIASMVMGVPVLRDFQYGTNALLFVNPITKRAYVLGRFLGSFVVILFIFSGLPFGMMLGTQMPWHEMGELLTFNPWTYFRAFGVVVVPSLFFGSAAFFVTSMLSKKLLVVYTQGIVLFVVFLLTKAITNAYVQGLLDPFGLTTLTQFTKDWTVTERNTQEIVLSGILWHHALLWTALAGIILYLGYRTFSFRQGALRSKRKNKVPVPSAAMAQNPELPRAEQHHDSRAKAIQLLALSGFYARSLLKEAAFWGIVICGVVVMAINSVNLGTVYGVDSYPATHFIIAELQEMSLYFFVILLLFYSGELLWKERVVQQHVLHDATPISSFVTIASKYVALVMAYGVLMIILIIAGILFQAANGYFQFDLEVYFAGFFIEIMPFLMLYTALAFFIQALSKNKFIGIVVTLLFFLANIGSEFFGFNHSLYKFGGKPLGAYSEMNGYGHFLQPYLWIKAYWSVFGILLLLGAALLFVRGQETPLWERLRTVRYRLTRPQVSLAGSALIMLILLGSYIFYNTNILNTYWSEAEERSFRANYEKSLKPLEYVPQPKITEVKLTVELYPELRGYAVHGTYRLRNTTEKPIKEIHIQKQIASHVVLKDVIFEGGAQADNTYAPYDYIIYRLSRPLLPQGSLTMRFNQSFFPKGFEIEPSDTPVVHNGTFFHNTLFPTLGYNRKYELRDSDERDAMSLPPRYDKARITDPKELVNARSGGDSDGIQLEVTLGTSENQTAITAGALVRKWSEGNRNYVTYRTSQPIINLYPIVSAEYEIARDHWTPIGQSAQGVDLEIYHHRGHTYNLNRMLNAMKASLDYYSRNFGPYPYRHLRIMEFPRYAEFAQSLPGTIPFSEALGFVLDIDDSTDVDMAFFVTAHEVAHQWFGMQVEAANVQGRNFILEALSQYAALMVLKKRYPSEKVMQFLELQEEIYERERKKAISEPTLALVGNEDYVYYNKGALAMYKLQELIGEEQVNLALQHFIEDWRSDSGSAKTEAKRYATSKDLLQYFKSVCPKEKRPTIQELFETKLPVSWKTP